MEAISFAYCNLLLNSDGFLVSLVYCGYSWHLSRWYIGKNKLASIPIEIPSSKRRPPIPGSPSHSLDVAPPLPFKKIRTPVSGVQPVSSPGVETQNLVHYSITETTTSGISRQISCDYVVVRVRHHILIRATRAVGKTSRPVSDTSSSNEQKRSLYTAAWY